jgi:hypothetical protein
VGFAYKSKKIIHSSFPPFFGGEAAVLFIYFYRTIESILREKNGGFAAEKGGMPLRRHKWRFS